MSPAALPTDCLNLTLHAWPIEPVSHLVDIILTSEIHTPCGSGSLASG